MDESLRFVKNDLEENLNLYFLEQSGRGETLASQAYAFNSDPSCPASERFGGYKSKNKNLQQFSLNSYTENFETGNQNGPASFKSYADFSNDYRKANYMNNEGYSPTTTEHISYSNPIESSVSHRYGNNNSDNLNYTRNYDAGGFSNYKNEDQLRNTAMFPLNRGELRNDTNYNDSFNNVGTYNDSQNIEHFRNDASRNEPQFGENVGTFEPYGDNDSTNYYQRNTVPLRSNSIPRNPHGFVDNIGPFDYRQQHQFGNTGPSDDQSNNYEYFSMDNENERKFRNNSRDKKRQLQRLDDGFVCVRNPEYFPESSRDNKHSSRDIRYKEKYRSNARSRNVRKQSQEDILLRGSGRKHSSSYKRGEDISREDILHRKDRGRENFKKNSRTEDRHEKAYDSNGNKYNKVNTTHESKGNGKYLDKKTGSGTYKKNKNNNYTNDDLPHYSRYSSKKRSADRIVPKRISELESHRKRRRVSRNTNLSSASQNSRKTSQTRSDICNETASTKNPETEAPKERIERKNFFVKLLKNKKRKAFEKRQRKATKVKEKAEEVTEDGIVKAPSKGHIKNDPENYWKEWWSKYAYIEKIIENVDADDEKVKEFIKFDYDIKKTDLDSKVSGVFKMALSKIKRADNINELNYERRIDVFYTLKYIKLLEGKDLQSFLLTKELQLLHATLKSVKSNKIMLALLYQSLICRWHISMEVIKSEESSSVYQIKQANKLINDKLFNYLVSDSINELKKLTLEDWPGFDEFYNNLQ